MQQTFQQFKDIIEQSSGSAPFEINPEMIEQFYKEQCLQQIGKYLDLTLGFFIQNHQEMSPEQLYEWSEAIREFFGINVANSGEITSEQQQPAIIYTNGESRAEIKQELQELALEETPVIELSKEEKIEQARKNLEKSGLWI